MIFPYWIVSVPLNIPMPQYALLSGFNYTFGYQLRMLNSFWGLNLDETRK